MKKSQEYHVNDEQIVLDLGELNNDFSVKVCMANYTRTHQPLCKHSHDAMTEIVYVLKGKQVYNVNGSDYVVNSGEVFITHPYEEHSSGLYPEDKSILYYILIDLEKHKNDIIGYKKEGELIVQSLNKIEKRVFKGNNSLKVILTNIINLYKSNHAFKQTQIRIYISQFLINIYDCAVKANEHRNESNMQMVVEYINSNIMDEIKIETLARICKLSVSRFKANFTSQVGMPPHEYILRQKIEIVKNILVTTDERITDIAYDMSFSSSQYLSTVFKKFTFKTPKEFRLLKTNLFFQNSTHPFSDSE